MDSHLHFCDHCSRVVAVRPGEEIALLLVEVEDIYGVWLEWLCDPCVDELLAEVESGDYGVAIVRLYGFTLSA